MRPAIFFGKLNMNLELPSFHKRFRMLIMERRRISASNFLDHLAELYGDKTIVILEEETVYEFLRAKELSYRHLAEIMNRMANSLKELGIRRSDRVIVYMRNRLELALACYALFKIGAVAIPLNHLLRGNEVGFIARDCEAKTVITQTPVFNAGVRDFRKIPEVKQWVFHEAPGDTPAGGISWIAMINRSSPYLTPEYAAPDDLAGIFYTSGTTGFPKGAQMTSENLIVNNVRMPGVIQTLAPLDLKEDVGLAVQPISHIMGFGMFLVRLTAGIRFVVLERFEPERVMEAIQRHKVTIFIGVPAMYAMMLKAGAGTKYDLSSVQLWVSGSDALPPEHRDAFKKFGKFKILGIPVMDAMFIEGYGQAETSPTSTMKPDLPITKENGCIGWALPGVEVKVADQNGNEVPKGDVGELWVRGKHVMKGYWKDKKATEEAFRDGWLRSGDLVRKGKWGLLYLVDREKDVIKVGGYSVFSREVEEELMNNHDISEAAVFGIPHEIKGQMPIAIVTLKPGSSSTKEQLLNWAKENIAPYKAPRYLDIVDELPRNPSLKVDKKLLKNRYKNISIDSKVAQKESVETDDVS